MFNRLSNLSNRVVLGILITIALITSGLSLIVNLTSDNANFAEWGEGWLQNFSTEMFGAFLTFVLLTLVVGNRQEKERLIRQMRSSINEEAIRAVEELRAHGWLEDGTLQEVNLPQANLQEARLYDANLERANLAFTNLQNADLSGANLRSVLLARTQLQGADLEFADVQSTKLQHADFDEHSVLPDGNKWTPDTDLSRFTDPAHPNFWRSDNSASPAYRGKDE